MAEKGEVLKSHLKDFFFPVWEDTYAYVKLQFSLSVTWLVYEFKNGGDWLSCSQNTDWQRLEEVYNFD
jgi:hypothetical protein